MSNPPPGDESKKRKRRSGWDVDNVEEGKKSSPWPPLPPTAPPQLSVPVPPPPSSSYPISTLTTSPLPGISSLLTPQLPKPNSRIYVGSINYDLREADLIALFSVFGPVVSCDMTLDNSTGKHKGFCFIQYSEPAHAEAAMTMDGFQVGGRKIKVGRPFNGNGTTSSIGGNPMGINFGAFPGANAAAPFLGLNANTNLALVQQIVAAAAVAQQAQYLNPLATVPSNPPIPSGPPPVTITGGVLSPCIVVSNIPKEVNIADVLKLFELHGSIKTNKTIPAQRLEPLAYYDVLLEYEDDTSAQNAIKAMQGYMLRKVALEIESISKVRFGQLQSLTLPPSKLCKRVRLDNMVTVEDTKDPGLEEEIGDEARNYGKLGDIVIEVNEVENAATITLSYEDEESALKSYRGLNGRLFAGRKIKATLLPENE